jgi:hypothetical protein
MDSHAVAHLKLLINLASIDQEISERERDYIYSIGRANGLAQAAVEPLFERQHKMIIPPSLTADEKFDYLFNLVQIMKIDQRLYRDEIRYCSQVAARLGFQQSVLFELLLHVKGQPDEQFKQQLRRQLGG